MEKQLLLTGTLNTLLLTDSSTTSITYKLVMLLIKRRKFLVKLSESILYETDVCLKRNKYRRETWVFLFEHSRKWEISFLFCVTEHLRHMACSVIKINTCLQDLQEIIIYKTIKKRTLLQSTKDILRALSFSMFLCATLYYKYAQSNSYRVLNFKLVKITDMNFKSFLNMWTLSKLDQKTIWLFEFHIGHFSYGACRLFRNKR